jgi:exosortase
LCGASHNPQTVGDLRHTPRIPWALGLEGIRIIKVALISTDFVRSIAIGLAALLVTAILAYWTAWAPLLRPHGYFVAFLAVVLAYAKRDQLAAVRVDTVPWALLALVPLCICAAFAALLQFEGLQFLFLPPLLLVAVTAAFGFGVARILVVPVLFLYFSAPQLSALVTPPLQALTVHMISIVGPALGLPLATQGNIVNFQNGITFVVTDACSGANFLIQGLALATLLGELERASPVRRVLLWVSMVPVALLGNWLRVIMIITLGYGTGMRSPLATSKHVAFGYAVFMAVLAVYVWAVSRTPIRDIPKPTPGTSVGWRPQASYYLVLMLMVSIPLALHVLGPTPDVPAHPG